MPDGSVVEGGGLPPGVDQAGRIDRRPVQAPIVDARNLLSQAFDAQVLPPERFRGEQEGEVVDIKKIGENVATLRKDGDHYVAYITDGKGISSRVILDPSTHEVAEGIKNNIIRVSPSTNAGFSPYNSLNEMGFGEEAKKDLMKQWYAYASRYWPENLTVEKTIILRKAPEHLTAGEWKMGILHIGSNEKGYKDQFVFTAGDTWNSFDQSEGKRKTINITNDESAEYITHGRTRVIGGMHLKKENTIFSFFDKEGNRLTDYSGTDPTVDPTDENQLYFIQLGRIYRLDLTGVRDRSTTPVLQQHIKLEGIKEIEMDPNGNFILARTDESKLYILDRKTGDVVKEFDGVKGPFLVDKQGDIVYADTNNKLREIQTNFQAIPPGGSADAEARREEQLREMQERFAGLDLTKVERQIGDQISEADVANTLRETIGRQVNEPIKQATEPEALEDILDRLQGLKGDPANQAYGNVIDEFITQAREKLSGIQTAELQGQLATFGEQLERVQSVGDTIGLDEQFVKLLELRGRIDITDPQARRDIEQRLRTLQTAKDTINTRYQGELVEAARDMLPQIEELIREAGSSQELAYFSTSTQAQQFEMMLANIRDPELRRELRAQYTQMKTEHRESLEARSREIDEQERKRWAQVVDEAREELATLREQIEGLSDTRELDRFDRSPLVTAWRAKLYALPPELRTIEEQKLEIILGARKKDVEHRKELGAVGEAGELKFGESTFPVYKEPPVLWQPRLVPMEGSMPGFATLVFEDSNGRIFKPNPDRDVVVVGDMSNAETQAAIDRYRGLADEHFKGMKRKVPDFDEHWRITDFHMERLEEITEALNLQQANHRGILLLQGEAGTGKNALIDIIGNLSNREVITIQCNENNVKEDLTYEFQYDPDKGTYRLPSELIEAIKRPGVIVFFDEINALKPGVAKLLNPLFDYRRRLGDDIADPTVLFVGAMNPQNYAGVSRLSPEVKSRSRVVDVDYPPFEEIRGGRTHWRSDEAEMLAGYMDEVGQLKQSEFRLVWNYLINRDTTNGAEAILEGNDTLREDVSRIRDVVRVANSLRRMYEAYQIGDSNEPMDFPVSLREVTDIVMEMNHRKGVKQIIKRVIIPKIDDRRQKRLVGDTIEELLPD